MTAPRTTIEKLVLPVACALALLTALGLTTRQPAVTQAAGVWTPTASMAVARGSQAAALLPNGDVLVAGGETQSLTGTAYLNDAAIYDPVAQSWQSVHPMTVARANFTLTTLGNGNVLAVGGENATGTLSSTEIFDPASGSWTPAASLNVARSGQTATLLQDGRLLVAGGTSSTDVLASAELYDPVSNTWTQAADMNEERANQAAVLMQDGRVMEVGGTGATGVLATAELYDPVANTWTEIAQMSLPRASETATLLPDGRVLVTGGFTGLVSTNTTEIYDPATHLWSGAAPMSVGRSSHQAVLLATGQVLVAGGQTLNGGTETDLASSEVYDPTPATWTPAGSMSSPRLSFTLTALPSGSALAVGGFNGGTPLTTADLYLQQPVPTDTAVATTSTATATIAPSPTVTAQPTVTPTLVLPTATAATPGATGTASPTGTPWLTTTPIPGTPVASATAVPTVAPSATMAPVVTPTPLPQPARFSIIAVRVENVGTGPDWQLKRPAVTSVQTGTKVRLSIYARFASLPATAKVQVRLVVTIGGRSVRRAGLISTLQSARSQNLWYHTTFVAAAVGAYQIVGEILVDGKKKSASTSLLTHAPPVPVVHPAFAFSKLTVYDNSGRATSTVHVSARATVIAVWMVRHLTGTRTMHVSEALEIRSGSGWQALGRPLMNAFDTSNGKHSFSFSFVPASAYGQMRIVLTLHMAGQTHQRATIIRVVG